MSITHWYQRGQIGLVVLLIGAVLATIGLGVASQSVLEVKTARQETDSSEAFNAAEQGIEKALQSGTTDSFSTSVDGGYSVAVNTNLKTDSYEGVLLVGHSAQLNLSGVSSYTLSWNDGGDCNSSSYAGMIVTMIDDTGLYLYRQAYGRCATEKSDGFVVPTACTSSECSVTISLGSLGFTPSLARIKSVYNDTQIDVALTGTNLQPQYYQIDALASKEGSGETRAVQVSQAVAAAPSIFDYTLFAGEGDITQ
jgi:hypothetical protein